MDHSALIVTFRERLRRPAPADLALAGLLLLGVVLVWVNTRGFSFMADDWEIMVDRRGFSAETLLRPHGPHLSLIPILIYKGILNTLGGGSFVPFRLIVVFDLLVLAGVMAWIGRHFWGPWWGLVPVALLVTLGPAATSLIWSFQCGYCISTAAGLAALMLAQRQTRRGDIWACVLLVISLASASQGIGLTAATLVVVAMKPGWLRRLWVVVIPAVLYGLWYLKYGRQASESELHLWTTALPYAWNGLSATIAGLTGTSSVNQTTGLLDTTYGTPLAAALLGWIAYTGFKQGSLKSFVWSLLFCLGILWFATAISNTGTYYRPPQDPRYLATDAVLVMALAVAVIPAPVAAATRGRLIAAALILLAIGATNASQYALQWSGYSNSDDYSRAELGAMLVMRGVVPDAFAPETTVEPAILVGVNAGNFFSGYDAWGIVSDSPAQLAAASEPVREAVDAEMARGELALAPTAPPRSSGCVAFAPGTVVPVPPARYDIVAGAGAVNLTAGRYGSNVTAAIGTVPAATAAALQIPADHDPHHPWRLTASAAGRICRVAA